MDAKNAGQVSTKSPLVGAWRPARIDEPGISGKIHRHTNRKGSLICSQDGHVSVQVIYPQADASSDAQYVRGGYEASYGSYDVEPRAHTIIHHVEGANARALVGAHSRRIYRLSGKQLTLRLTQPQEHWAVTWTYEDAKT